MLWSHNNNVKTPQVDARAALQTKVIAITEGVFRSP